MICTHSHTCKLKFTLSLWHAHTFTAKLLSTLTENCSHSNDTAPSVTIPLQKQFCTSALDWYDSANVGLGLYFAFSKVLHIFSRGHPIDKCPGIVGFSKENLIGFDMLDFDY